MLEHFTRDDRLPLPSFDLRRLTRTAGAYVEIVAVRRFLVMGLPEYKVIELREILQGTNGTDLASTAGANAQDVGPVLLVAVGEALPSDACFPLSSPTIAIVGRSLPNVDRLLQSGFLDYITYPFSALEIQRRLFAMQSVNPCASVSTAPRITPMVQAACGFLEVNLANSVTVEELAARMGTNRNTLNKAFNLAYGVGPMTWLRQRRCEIAAQLLRDGSGSVLDIALSVGYEDPSNFSTAFRRIYDQGPMEFRKKFKAQRA